MPLTPPVKSERTILGHPPGLFVLFFTEMWERFSYYGMRSLLVLYMVDHLFLRPDVHEQVLGFSAVKGLLESIFGPLAIQPLSSQIYGLYTAFVYLTPFFGGMLADRVMGQRKAVILGAVLMAIGEFLLVFEGAFFFGLLFLIVGNGAFKPNIATQVGGLYPEGDPRRDRAFTIFYMGVNLGAFLSPLVCGTLGQKVGWNYGFGAAGVGMVCGLLLYLWGQRHLAPDTLTIRKAEKLPSEPLTHDEWKRALCGQAHQLGIPGIHDAVNMVPVIQSPDDLCLRPGSEYRLGLAGSEEDRAIQRGQDGHRLLPAGSVLYHNDRCCSRA
jgi:POT family proton-dependent oligopeptide transporter